MSENFFGQITETYWDFGSSWRPSAVSSIIHRFWIESEHVSPYFCGSPVMVQFKSPKTGFFDVTFAPHSIFVNWWQNVLNSGNEKNEKDVFFSITYPVYTMLVCSHCSTTSSQRFAPLAPSKAVWALRSLWPSSRSVPSLMPSTWWEKQHRRALKSPEGNSQPCWANFDVRLDDPFYL